MSTMTLPGFSAAASLYRTNHHYATTATETTFVGGVVPQLSKLSVAPWPWCRDACDYCKYYGLYCWPCFICAIYPGDAIATDFTT